jgi:hypothetical protein
MTLYLEILPVHVGNHGALNRNVELLCSAPSVTQRAGTLRKLHSLQLMRTSSMPTVKFIHSSGTELLIVGEEAELAQV